MFYAKEANKRKRWYRLLTVSRKKIMLVVVIVGLIVVMFLSALVFYTCRAMQYDLDQVVDNAGVSVLYDINNRPLVSLSNAESRPLEWAEVPQNLINAFVAREDEQFFEHDGVVLSSVMRSIMRNISSMRYEQGASTISMQLTRNVFDMREKTMDRKLLEVVLTQRLERNFDKQTIMLQYLSRIYYGENCYGVRAAADRYFGKKVSELNLVECATLAGLVRAPSLFNPVHSMKAAMKVKEETLLRMLDCEMITEEQCHEAIDAPIVLSKGSAKAADASSYTGMWARQELDDLQAEIGKGNGGVFIVSSLRLDLQQFVETASEKALMAVENSSHYPEAWMKLKNLALIKDAAEAQREDFKKTARPKEMKLRGRNNDVTDVLQSCVMVVDNRKPTKGRIMALTAGRSAADGCNRWQERVKPGRAIAPVLFCCACLPGSEDMHIIAQDAKETGRSLGYTPVKAFFDSLKLDVKLPDMEHADDLYGGMFSMRRIDLARVLYSVQNKGYDYQLRMINSIWNCHRSLLYTAKSEAPGEYIKRQAATIVAELPPFELNPALPHRLYVNLPEHGGAWVMLIHEGTVCVFVWMGFDHPKAEIAGDRGLRRMLGRAASSLAYEIYYRTRELMDEEKKLRLEQMKQEEMKKNE